jgi:spore coat polysaccharide biosynthesis protein SpsF
MTHSDREKTMKEKVVGILVARQTSSRLPGKALVDVVGKPMIGHILDRIEKASHIDEVIVATSTNPEDNAIVEYAESRGIRSYQGATEDVLDRIYKAAKFANADVVVEVGGDVPFVTPDFFDYGIEQYYETKADFISNTYFPPITYPVGYDFMLITMKTLEKLYLEAVLDSERYLPFHYISRNPQLFKIHNLTSDIDLSAWRWTLDYPEDLDFIRTVFDRLLPKNPFFGLDDIRQLFEEDPAIIEINAMHSDPVEGSTAWHTGSFVRDSHNDIQQLLDHAFQENQKNNHVSSKAKYKRTMELINELIARSEIMVKREIEESGDQC